MFGFILGLPRLLRRRMTRRPEPAQSRHLPSTPLKNPVTGRELPPVVLPIRMKMSAHRKIHDVGRRCTCEEDLQAKADRKYPFPTQVVLSIVDDHGMPIALGEE